jgi:hypothetical protein
MPSGQDRIYLDETQLVDENVIPANEFYDFVLMFVMFSLLMEKIQTMQIRMRMPCKKVLLTLKS